ncbi:hypothetical protein BH23ACT5_BH23ACT5_17570 [soil metagenome]
MLRRRDTRLTSIHLRSERALLVLEVLLGVGAFGAAAALIMGAVDFGEAAERLPFGSLVFGGVALALVNGVLPAAVVVATLRRKLWSRWGHVVVGASLMAWIVVQVYFLGPPIVVLQVVYFVWGATIAALALALRRHEG